MLMSFVSSLLVYVETLLKLLLFANSSVSDTVNCVMGLSVLAELFHSFRCLFIVARWRQFYTLVCLCNLYISMPRNCLLCAINCLQFCVLVFGSQCLCTLH